MLQKRCWIAIGICLAATAFGETSGGEQSNQLDEIVVTATKRASTVFDTPMSLTAVTGEDLQNRGITDLISLTQSIPGVSMRTAGPGETEFEMRGMTSSGGNSPTVGFYLDDTPLTAPADAQNGKVVIDPNLYDLSRVEVLRGPQGTLYGSGSMGGTIKVVPNPPDPALFDASAEGIVGHTDGGDSLNTGENAMVNIPLGADTAALRIVGSESHDSGWINRIVIAPGQFPLETNNFMTRGNVLAAPVAKDYRDVNYTDLTGARATLLWNATDRLTITPSFFYQEIRQGGQSAIDSNPGTNAHYEVYDASEPFADRFNLASLNIHYQFDAFEVTSATAHWTRDETIAQDGTETQQWGFGLPSFATPTGLGPSLPTPLEDDMSKQISEEIRFTSSGDSAFKWLAGYFYSHFKSDWNFHVLAVDLPEFLPAARLHLNDNLFTNLQPTEITQNAAFGEISYQITSDFKATAGLRRYSYRTSVVTDVSGYSSPTGDDSVFHSAAAEAAQGLNPKVDLSYGPSKNLMLYVTAAKGFRPGGGNEPVPTGPTGLGPACLASLEGLGRTSAPTAFGPDSVWSYELGEKARLFGNRVTINSDVYFEKWVGVQQNIPLTCGFFYTDNAGDAQVKGAEFEISAILFNGLVLSANTGYTHAAFSVGSREAGVVAGDRVQDVPDWTATADLTYKRSMAHDLTLAMRVENNYVGTRIDATYSINHLPSYDLTTIRVGLEGIKWAATLFAKNVFNERALLTDTTCLTINPATFNRIAVSQPLTMGLDLTYRFGSVPR
jgi:iron complex outermembrane recepter protein